MTTLSKDEIMRLARKAGINVQQGFLLHFAGVEDDLEKFAALCRADLVAENGRLKSSESMSKWVELLAERDALKADAEQWRAYKSRKDAMIAAGMGRNPLRKEAK